MRWTGNHVKLLRRAYRMTQEQFAERVGVGVRSVGYWEQRGETAILSDRTADLMETLVDWLSPDARNRFDTALAALPAPTHESALPRSQSMSLPGPAVSDLEFVADLPAQVDKPVGMNAMTPTGLQWIQELLVPDEGVNVHRRELLRLLAAIAGAAGPEPLLATLSGGTKPATLPAAGHVDEHVLDQIETALGSTLRLDDAVGPHAALETAAAQYRLTGALLTGCANSFRPRLLSLHSNLARLLGWLNFNLGRYDLAQQAYARALDAAHEAEDAAQSAITLCQMSHLDTWRGAARSGVDRGVAAQNWARQTSDVRLRAYAADVTARAFAAARQPEACLEALDLIGDISREPAVDPTISPAYFYNAELATSTRGLCLLDLGDTTEATRAFSESLIDGAFKRNQAFNLVYLSRARLAAGEIDECAAVAGSAVGLAVGNPSPRLITVLTDIRTDLRPWQETSAVREFGEQVDAYLVGSVRT